IKEAGSSKQQRGFSFSSRRVQPQAVEHISTETAKMHQFQREVWEAGAEAAQPPPIPSTTLPVPAQSGQGFCPTLPEPLQVGQMFSPVPGVPGGASSRGCICDFPASLSVLEGAMLHPCASEGRLINATRRFSIRH